MNYKVNDINLQYEPKGETKSGEHIVLLDRDTDLTATTRWTNEGFSVEKLFSAEIYQQFSINAHALLIDRWKKSGLVVPKNFPLDQYHILAIENEKHLAALEQTKIIPTTEFPVDIKLLEQRVSEICGRALNVFNPYDNQSVFHFRVIRPGKPDYNPLHRDVWLEDYKDCVNLYIPIAGSNEKSSLIIVPESHHWPESMIERTVSGAVMSNATFNVPAVTKIDGAVSYVRPNPSSNEVLIFSPYLIHGGSSNLNTHSTRISMEIRLWIK